MQTPKFMRSYLSSSIDWTMCMSCWKSPSTCVRFLWKKKLLRSLRLQHSTMYRCHMCANNFWFFIFSGCIYWWMWDKFRPWCGCCWIWLWKWYGLLASEEFMGHWMGWGWLFQDATQCENPHGQVWNYNGGLLPSEEWFKLC